MKRGLLNLLVFAAAFLAVRGVISERTPERMKLAWLEAQKDEVDALFIGSSRVFRQIDPARFDARMAAAGRPLRSLNMGMQGMRFPETAYLVERILEMEPGRLEYLFLELSEFETDIEEENRLTERLVYWHSWPVTWQLCRTVAAQDLPFGEKLARIEGHLVHWGHRFGNLGNGDEALRGLAGSDEADFEGRRTLGPDGNGYRSLSIERTANFLERRRLFLEDLDQLRRARETLLAPDGDEPADAALVPVLERLNALCAARGVTPVYLVLPVIEKQTPLVRLHDAGLAPLLIRFDQPDAWPAFYQPRNRFDIHHLNAQGAALMTDALADELLRLVRAPG
ncbi:MAG: hypothetical protein H8E31_13700 [Planctomycetes bacterium]|nr:hypothetical protein [Planctomycetota bacterium]